MNINHPSRWSDFSSANLRHAFKDILTETISRHPGTLQREHDVKSLADLRDLATTVFYATLVVLISEGAAILQARMNIDPIGIDIREDKPILPSLMKPSHSFCLGVEPFCHLVLSAVSMGGDCSRWAPPEPRNFDIW